MTITAFQNGFRHVRPGRSVDKLGDQGGMARAAKVIRKLKNQLELELELFHIFRFHSFRCLAIRSIGSILSIGSIGSIGCGELLSRALEFSAAFCLWPGISARTSSAGAMVGLWLWGRIQHDFATRNIGLVGFNMFNGIQLSNNMVIVLPHIKHLPETVVFSTRGMDRISIYICK